ncbi:pimeloyl-ACP methyl ester carboxylesterase [Lipingzhangella halophila]|uniref:Pimeloyl-ACP methyl ester carboxylesterase n=1 Tax=Lipingzhangella halophila TaxID=1783352 RepID=A0A7W7RNX4_9ACTN|nr:epoxide hydrolase family protein [Lipingzhangella halophila]MBB4935480.1 pimeloyl-ACP methyl ester carboxylesterase [Lipingzhangella halophila]
MTNTNGTTADIRPFRVDVPQRDLDDLADRLARVRWTEELPDAGGDYGVPVSQVRRRVDYWRSQFDWRALEGRLNSYPQFTTEIDGANIHFLHVRSPEPDALPLILTHGWPGSIVEYLDVIGPLTDPRAYGRDPGSAFHLVIPSIPGFAFSGATTERGWNRYRVARAWAELMRRLGYERYGAVGNDAGSFIAPEVGRVDPEHVAGVHVTQIFSFPSGDPAEFEGMTEEEMAALQHLQWFHENMSAFNQLQAQQPQTLAHAVADSPAGLVGWNGQLFADEVGDEFALANIAIYWLTGTAASAMRFYYEDAHPGEEPREPTTVPLGLAGFAGDFQSIRRFAERDHTMITSWNTYDRGGHYAAHEAPDLFTADVRTFYAGLR